MPNPENCAQATVGNVGHLQCSYGDIGVEVFAIRDAISMSELRDLAFDYAELPPRYWQWEGMRHNVQGYSNYEAWTAEGNGIAVLGLVGQSSRSDVGHIVFVYGSQSSLDRNTDTLMSFITNIEAI